MRIHFWNLILSLFFLLLVVMGTLWLMQAGRIFYSVPVREPRPDGAGDLPPHPAFHVRRHHRFIRDWFVGAQENTLRHTLGVLLNCPWCIGLWFGFTVVFFYYSTVYSWPIILGLAIAALASVFQIAANWIGWSAEAKKMEAQRMVR